MPANIRTSQVVTETAVEAAGAAKIRTSQVVAETAFENPSHAKLRLSQIAIETATEGIADVRGTQLVAEVVIELPAAAHVRGTQIGTDVVTEAIATGRVRGTQLVAEVVIELTANLPFSASDTEDVTLTESAVVGIVFNGSDDTDVTVTEASAVTNKPSSSDSFDVIISEGSTVVVFGATTVHVNVSDSEDVTVTESSVIDVRVLQGPLVTQEFVETTVDGTPNARITQEFLETSVNGDPNARITQEFLETSVNGDPNARVTQEFVETTVDGTPKARVTQEFVETLVDPYHFILFEPTKITLSEISGISVPIRSSDSIDVSLDDKNVFTPQLFEVHPSPIPAGTPDVILYCIGRNFVPPHSPGSRIVFNGTILNTTFISDKEVATILDPNIITGSVAQVHILNPDGYISNTISVPITPAKAAVRLGDLSSGHYPFPPRPNDSASLNVFVNGKPWHRLGDHWAVHCAPVPNCHDGRLAKASNTVFINGIGAGRVGDPISCGDFADQGSPNVFAGDTVQPPKYNHQTWSGIQTKFDTESHDWRDV